MLKDSTKWYASWFDTPYYHILYKNRDYAEAELFMKSLTHYLNLEPGDPILDLACGKGRHSIYLNSMGYHVTGADLSENSITHASQFANETLHFKVHDMRKPFASKFEAVFNLFTSFGYFENEEDNLDTIKAIQSNLNTNGCAVLDFMNVDHVLANLIPEETKTIENIDFYIKRYLKNGYIHKEINFEAEGKAFSFVEKVKALTLENFQNYFAQAGVHLLEIFGDYNLNTFHKDNSPRLILVFK